MERLGIEHVPSSERHGSTINQFTLWLASNLTVADYGLGAILYSLGLPMQVLVSIMVIGNIAGGLLVGLLAAMGPEFGYPQMMISRGVFGERGNAVFAAANWVSTIGWFSVNAIIGGYLISFMLPRIPLYLSIVVSVAIQFIIALYGYDAIHRMEKWLSVALGVLFAVAAAAAIITARPVAVGGSVNPELVAVGLATVFSYIMSWGPYASDYSRYLPENTGKARIVAGAMAGGALASAWSEAVGFLASAATGNSTGSPVVLAQLMGRFGGAFSALAIIALFLGALAANVLNLYTNSLSAMVLHPRMKRQTATILAVTAGVALAVMGGLNFEGYFEGFLLMLDYWITPWIGVVIGSYYIKRGMAKQNVDEPVKFNFKSIAAYAIGLAVSIPFMNLSAATGGLIPFTGPISSIMGGADVSYFISFAAAMAAAAI